MAKSAVFLLIVGFALGMWVGFNPQLHKQVVDTWDHAKASFMNIQAQVSGKASNSSNNTVSQPAPQTQVKSKPGAQPTSVVWRQISSMFAALWNSMQHIWLQIRADLNLKKL